jgi:hypothetical protein
MSTSRPFAYNTGSTIDGTEQVGDIAIGTDITQPYGANYGGVQWWAGPDEDLGYVICKPIPAGNQPNPLNIDCFIGFERSDDLTDQSFINLANAVFPGNNFTTASGAKSWMDTNGYWSSYVGGTGATGSTGGTGGTGGVGGTGDFNVTITQVGPNVVWSGSGSFNLNSLTLVGSLPITSGFQANNAIWVAGASTTPPGPTGQQYGGASLTYPTTFLSGTQTGGPSATTGSMFGILTGGASGRTIVVPDGYVSGTTISGSTTYANQTIAGMGLSGGTYTWSWGSGPNASSLTMTIGATGATGSTGGTGEGWEFYYAEGSAGSTPPPLNDGEVIFIYNTAQTITYNPNYSGSGGFQMLFNENQSDGSSYLSAFNTLVSSGGTVAISQGSNTAIYAGGVGIYFVQNFGSANALIINAQAATLVQPASAPFTSGTPITLTIS